ncbi:hypothetical protein VB796_21190 [Arcicella sp. LKC2W]|uniref:hypothetical protein n=1 Tax=Arcicella sp. LKC2W TaxID=2984198 RepID=UPI002B1F1F3D|nr:hypothetical protein [Arcicella sp. LKC2W]MEA5461596.1 hypothetical protein [Arcicella sp. LKC2W]
MKLSDNGLLGVTETPSYLVNFFYWHNDWLKVFVRMNNPEYRNEFEEVLNNTSRNYLLLYCFEICQHKSKDELEDIINTTNKECQSVDKMDFEYYHKGFL